ncbi:S-adenosyl-L-methionine-dependent methyltransferase [Annulohypoxylon bovei var. microspora]|nr:S-adenosyl-L-methionine-dependent methyltransferase [Annulohypoxylon bovei var. microspora]
MADQPTTPGPEGAAPLATTGNNGPELIPAAHAEDELEDDFDDDADSALGDDTASSTNSITASILEYRTIKGRTYHSEKHESNYFAPNDEQQMHSQDITHHYLTVMLGDKLFLAPVNDDIEKVLDVGTGTGIWAIDVGDQYPNAEVLGTDLSPTQPLWVPPNVRFEIDDCTKEWTWPADHFDFIHMRYLFGAIADWSRLFQQAFRCCKPGGWVQSCECDVEMCSDDGSIKENGVIETFWNPLYKELGKKIGLSFQVLENRFQNKGFEEAGFVDIKEVNYKLPIGGWPKDPKLAEVGGLTLLTMINDLEGYVLVPWNVVHGEETPGYQETLAHLRKELKSRSMHAYMKVRYVYGRKP